MAQRRARESVIVLVVISIYRYVVRLLQFSFDLYDAAAPWGPRPPKVQSPEQSRSCLGAVLELRRSVPEPSKNRPKKTMIF